MGGEKRGSKSGRYVGGFLQLFDWNAKSRKKLFPCKSDLPEQPKQGKRSEGNMPLTRMLLVDEDEYGGGFTIRGGSEYSYPSSVTDEDGYGTKAPGVVARLMGLDSLPTSNGMEPCASPFFDTISLQDAPFRGRNLDLYRDHQIMQSNHLFEKVDSTKRTVLDTRSQKIPNRPIEKFQAETLPPKSAKTIPITHHKLLSPIKSPIFVPSQDAAHIMEAAARIIDPGNQAPPRTKLSTVRSSSVPLKVRELREKLEATQRPVKAADSLQRQVESYAAKTLRGQPMNKSWNGTDEAAPFKVSPSRESSSLAKSKGKSISLAIQAKVNVQRREGLVSSSRSSASVQDDTKSTQSIRDQASSSKSSNRKAMAQSTTVLRQNNQKQNCPAHRDRPTSKTSVATSTGKRAVTDDAFLGRHKNLARDAGTSRTTSRKSSLQARESDKVAPCTGAKNVPRKKRSIDGGPQFNKNLTDNMLAGKIEKPSQSSMVVDRQLNWIEESRRKGLDVVSFTFTAPITRSLPVSEPSRQLAEKSGSLSTDDRSKLWTNSDVTKLSSPGFNGIQGDALSILLEQKLKELASNLGSPHSFVKTGTSVDSVQQNVFSPGSVESAIGKAGQKAAQQGNDTSSQISSDLIPSEHQSVRRIFNFKAGETLEDRKKIETKPWDACHLPSPVSILEPLMLTESCYSSESMTSSTTEESKPCSSVLAQEVVGFCSSRKFVEVDVDTSDSATSTSSQIAAKTYPMIAAWELGYVKEILSNVELMFKDYMACQTREIVNPHLFDQMEKCRGGTQVGGAELKSQRKVLFACVSECMDLRCQRFVEGGYEMWMKGIASLKRKERLAEEVYKEIQEWRSLGNCMVDELVDKDMSSKYGRWLDFEVDEFMLGVDIESQILDSMVVDIVADFKFSFR